MINRLLSIFNVLIKVALVYIFLGIALSSLFPLLILYIVLGPKVGDIWAELFENTLENIFNFNIFPVPLEN